MKPKSAVLKGYIGRHCGDIENDPEDRTILYNNVSVKWFIGDGIFNEGKLTDNWHAWGYANGHAYQMYAVFNLPTKTLNEISVLDDKTNAYFHLDTFNMLTK